MHGDDDDVNNTMPLRIDVSIATKDYRNCSVW